MLNRHWRHLSTKEKTTALILFGVLLPTLVLFYGQFRALSELRDKSKAVFKSDLRQAFFEIEDKTEALLLEAVRDFSGFSRIRSAAVGRGTNEGESRTDFREKPRG